MQRAVCEARRELIVLLKITELHGPVEAEALQPLSPVRRALLSRHVQRMRLASVAVAHRQQRTLNLTNTHVTCTEHAPGVCHSSTPPTAHPQPDKHAILCYLSYSNNLFLYMSFEKHQILVIPAMMMNRTIPTYTNKLKIVYQT